MKRESGKSIALFLLVGISLTLTWSLWSYQGDYAPVNPPKPTNTPDIASAYKISEVIKPYQIIRYETSDPDQVLGKYGSGGDTLYKLLLSASPLTLHTQLPEHFPKIAGPTYELDFPTPLTTAVIDNLFKFTQTNGTSISSDWLIDRVEVFQTDSKSDTAYLVFKDQLGHPKFYAKGAVSGLSTYSSDVEKSGDWLKYRKLPLSDKLLYVPNQPIHSLSVENSLYTLIGFEQYKTIVFSSPRQVTYSGNIYSDAVSQLESKQKLVMQYVNPLASSSSSSSSGAGTFGDPILQSYDFINSHKGWTNTFNIDNLTTYPISGQSKVIFRMTQHGLPVFSSAAYPYDIESEISLQWNGSNYSQFYRTLLKLGESFNPTDIQLPSPFDELALLKKTNGFKLSNVSDFKLGYQMTLNQSHPPSVRLTPSWFFEENGTWMSVTDYLNSHNTVMKNSGGGGS